MQANKVGHTSALRAKAKKIGHYAMARWMKKNGYGFGYAYFIIFGQRNRHGHF